MMDDNKYHQPFLRTGSYYQTDKNNKLATGSTRIVDEKYNTDSRVFSDNSYPTKVVRSEIVGYVKK